ncbi:hypothetical protein ACJX0J_017947, partial [Zea mays]
HVLTPICYRKKDRDSIAWPQYKLYLDVVVVFALLLLNAGIAAAANDSAEIMNSKLLNDLSEINDV